MVGTLDKFKVSGKEMTEVLTAIGGLKANIVGRPPAPNTRGADALVCPAERSSADFSLPAGSRPFCVLWTLTWETLPGGLGDLVPDPGQF